LEAAIGLVFVYLVLSSGCSMIKEVVAWMFGLRSKTLEAAIQNMLNDPNNVVTAKIFAHPLIKGSAQANDKPSYISSRTFASALFDTVFPADQAPPKSVEELRAALDKMPDTPARKIVLGFARSAGDNLANVRKDVENWFDDSMDRVSGWYKRKAQLIIAVAGLVLCVASNADTVMIVNELWRDQALRTTVEAAAVAGVKAGAPSDSQPTLTAAIGDVQTIKELPIGWKRTPKDAPRPEVRGIPIDCLGWTKKVLGILISILAVSMGAPFWFDILSKMGNLRLSGNPPKPAAASQEAGR
jgi:hypothetical protein